MDVVFWLCRRWMLVVWTLHLVGWMYGRWILVVLTLYFDCLNVGFSLLGRWISIGWVDVGLWLCGCLDVGF